MKNGSQSALTPQDALYTAADECDFEATVTLLTHYFDALDINEPNENGESALRLATLAKPRNNNLDFQYHTISKLIDKGADPLDQNDDGLTAFDLAQNLNNQYALKALNTYALKDSPFNMLSEDALFKKIVGFLPDYSRYGRYALNVVCRSWNASLKVIEKTHKSINELVDSNPEPKDLLNMLSDEGLFDQVPFETFLEMVSSNAAISIAIIDSGILINDQIAYLGTNNLAVAQHIMDTLSLSYKLGRENLSRLGDAHISIAQRLISLSKGKLASIIANALHYTGYGKYALYELSKINIAFFGMNHESIAKQLLEIPDFFDNLDLLSFWNIGEMHLSIAKQIMQTPRLRKKLDNHSLALLGFAHEEIAWDILNDPVILLELDSYDLACLGAHESTSLYIFEDKILLERIEDADLPYVGKGCLQVAWQLLPKIITLADHHSLLRLMEYHQDIAWHVLRTPSLHSKLGGAELAKIALEDISFARHIMNTPELCDKLNKRKLVAIANEHVSIARHIFDTNSPTLLNKLDKIDRLSIASTHVEIARFVINYPQYFNLTNADLIYLGCQHPTIALSILIHKDIGCMSAIKSADLVEMANSPAVIKEIFKNPHLRSKLKPGDLAFLEGRKQLYETALRYASLLRLERGNNVVAQDHKQKPQYME